MVHKSFPRLSWVEHGISELVVYSTLRTASLTPPTQPPNLERTLVFAPQQDPCHKSQTSHKYSVQAEQHQSQDKYKTSANHKVVHTCHITCHKSQITAQVPARLKFKSQHHANNQVNYAFHCTLNCLFFLHLRWDGCHQHIT